jgi:hypothetical protein
MIFSCASHSPLKVMIKKIQRFIHAYYFTQNNSSPLFQYLLINLILISNLGEPHWELWKAYGNLPNPTQMLSYN